MIVRSLSYFSWKFSNKRLMSQQKKSTNTVLSHCDLSAPSRGRLCLHVLIVTLSSLQVDRLEDELMSEQEKYKAITEELEQTFAEMSGY